MMQDTTLTQSLVLFSRNQQLLDSLTSNSNGGFFSPGRRYPTDVRIRIAATLSESIMGDGFLPNGALTRISNEFGVSRRTVSRIFDSLEEFEVDLSEESRYEIAHGGLSGSLRREKKLDEPILSYVVMLLDQYPFLYLHELSSILKYHWDIDISSECIRLNSNNSTEKRLF